MKDFIRKIYKRLRFFIPVSLVILVAISILTFLSVKNTTNSVNNLLERSLDLEVEAIYKMFEREYNLKIQQVGTHLKVLHNSFYSSDFKNSNEIIVVDAENQITKQIHKTEIKKWYWNNELLLENHALVDTIKYLVGGTATIFQKIDSGYLRISTNVQTVDNQRAVGTFIPNNSPVVQTIEKGGIYYGRAYVVSDWYITAYEPLRNELNEIIGMLYVGNREKNLDDIREILHQIKIGNSGYVFAMDTSGNVIIHPSKEGQNWADSAVFQQIIKEKNGAVKYLCSSDKCHHLISFRYFKEFDLIVAAEIVQEKEVAETKSRLIKNSVFTALVSLAILSLVIFLLTYRSLRSSFRKIDKTKRALEISETKFETLFDNSSDEIYVSNLDGNFIEINKVACLTLGYSRDELLTMNFSDIKKGKYRSMLMDNINKIKEFGEATYESEHLCKDGRMIAVEMKSRLINYEGNEVILSVARNIEERKAMQKRIISTVIKTEEKERKKFAADLHDELGPVLSTIKLYSDLLKTKPIEDEKSKELINDIDGLTDMAISTTRDLQNRITPTILHDFGLATAIEEFSNYINKTKSIKISVDSSEYKVISESIVETIIFQVTKELIHNTLKHASARNIKIELKVLNNQLILYYKDDGVGFDFDEMLQTSQGLGLNNIVNKVKTIKGMCDFNSRPDKGMFVLITVKLKD
ncbi:MAG: Cache 3/Cache 2 fusion domain-containing protein [Bacteroidales bacterium]|nr:Cache 3/Cache 2 fusion domain-containing protein [Bacteroidales bacterium]